MEPLSRNKKIGIFSLVVLILTIVGLFFTGNWSLSGLKSDVLNQACTEKGQKNKLPQYTASLNKRDQAQKTLDIASGEIAVLKDKIVRNQEIIAEKQTQIEKKKTNIAELSTFIEKNCKGRLANSVRCRNTIQQRKDLSQELRILNNDLRTLQNTSNQLARKILNNQRIITQQTQLIARLTLFINQYEACDRQLNAKPILTSPLMSGEAHMSGEALVSGEACTSNEVLISGEIHVAGEVNVPVYRLAVSQEYPSKAEVELIDFNLSGIDTTTLQISDWFVAEEGTSNILSKCSFLDENNEQLRCIPGSPVVVQSETRNYVLYAKVQAITGIGSFKIYSAVIAYNGGKGETINQTTTLEMKYSSETFCESNGSIDFELKRLAPWSEFNPNDPNQSKYLFGSEVCVHGPLSVNELKKTIPALKDGLPWGYTVIGPNGAISFDISAMNGWVEDMKNGQCTIIALNIQPKDQAAFDIAQKVVFALDYNDVVKETNETNNAKELTIQSCPEYSAPICKQGEELVPSTNTDVNGCPLPPVCQEKRVVCPSVCVPLYELNNQCQLNTCGSGCGADNVNTFSTSDACKKTLGMLELILPTTDNLSTR